MAEALRGPSQDHHSLHWRRRSASLARRSWWCKDYDDCLQFDGAHRPLHSAVLIIRATRQLSFRVNIAGGVRDIASIERGKVGCERVATQPSRLRAPGLIGGFLAALHSVFDCTIVRAV